MKRSTETIELLRGVFLGRGRFQEDFELEVLEGAIKDRLVKLETATRGRKSTALVLITAGGIEALRKLQPGRGTLCCGWCRVEWEGKVVGGYAQPPHPKVDGLCPKVQGAKGPDAVIRPVISLIEADRAYNKKHGLVKRICPSLVKGVRSA